MKKILLTSVLCASTIFAASDPSKTYSYEVTPFASGILTDSKADLKHNNYLNLGISLAKNLDDSFIDQVEVAYMRSAKVDYDNSNETTHINRTFLNAIKKFELTDRLAAYGLAGVGYQDVTNEVNKHVDSAVLNYGVGLRYDIPYYGIALKGDVRHLIALKENQNDLMYTIGLGMPLGKTYKNNDIVATVPVVEEPKAALVEEAPTPIITNDDDRDGVINSLDKCPNTSPGVKVNKDGCVDTVDLKINFDTNSANVKSSYDSKINQFANMMRENKGLTAVIEAHTDSKGSDSYNQTLSEKRAASVVNALRDSGVESSRLKAIGYGETQPIASNATEEGKAQNRRVTALVNE